jgi:hypothetical protein
MKPKNILHAVLFSMCLASALPAQNPLEIHRCGTTTKMQKQAKYFPQYERLIDQSIQHAKSLRSTTSASTTLFVPIHIIIVHHPDNNIGSSRNPSIERIKSQIDALNRDFLRQNADTLNTPEVFKTGNPNIQFCLASIDPQGKPTNGITRYATTDNFDLHETDIKGVTAWSYLDYLNVWVADTEDLGFAYIPTTASLPNGTLDGVSISYTVFGGPNTGAKPPYNLGRTLVHEVGHYLGLRHIWRSNGCDSDDGFEDTPLQDHSYFDCPVHPSPSCNNSGDMFMNYMDYTNDACMNAFSFEQSMYMRSILEGIRANLLKSGAKQCQPLAPLSLKIKHIQNTLCYGEKSGAVTIEGSGGAPPYVYYGANFSNEDGVFTNLPAGTYKLIIQDAKKVTNEISVEIKQPLKLEIEKVIVTDNPCHNNELGSIEIKAKGGTQNAVEPLLYSINKNQFTTNAIYKNLSSTIYDIVVKDKNNCLATTTATIKSPSPINTTNLSKQDLMCFGETNGTLTIQASGGTLPYTFSTSSQSNTSGQFTNLNAARYVINIQDANGCKHKDSIDLFQPLPLDLKINLLDKGCEGGASARIKANASGGKPGYFYSLDGINFSINPEFENLKPGIYDVHITDGNSCRQKTQIAISNPEKIKVEPIIIKRDGNIDLSIRLLGGTAPYQYFINDDTKPNIDSIFKNLLPGSYLIKVIDAKGCTGKGEVVITNTHDQSSLENLFLVAPNPVQDVLRVQYLGTENEEVNLEIYDILGRKLYGENKIIFSAEKKYHNIFVNNIDNSIFIFKIAMKFKSLKHKIYKI